MEKKKNKICGLSTLPVTIKSFMVGNLNYMAEHGYESYCICQPDEKVLTPELLGNVKYIPVKIKWGYVSPIEAIRTILRLYKVFKREKFDIIQYATFNAAFCASIAGWLTRVPVRINLQWGLSYSTSKGFQHYFRRTVDKLTCMFSTSVQPDSKTNLKFAIDDHLYPAKKGDVLYNGSACGVDLERFDIRKRKLWRQQIVEEYHLENYRTIFGFVGRVLPEKGINELLEAFMNINDPQAFLFIVGPMDVSERLNQQLLKEAKEQKNIVFTGGIPAPEKYFAGFDFFVLPSYQEGFGLTVLEAAGVGTPSIVSNIKGPTDFVTDNYNGLLCEARSVSSLEDAIRKSLTMSKDEYSQLAKNAYNVVKKDFDSVTFKEHFLNNRNELLKKAEQDG